MLGDRDVITFVPTRRREAARDFYERVLGLEFASEDAFALVFRAHGVMLRVVDVGGVEGFSPAPFTILGWQVPSADGAVRELGARGVVFERYAGMAQSPEGIWTSPSGARVAWFKDPDGNVLSVTEG